MMTLFQSKDKLLPARTVLRTAMALCAVLAVSACGIKPGQLTPPGGQNAPAYPGTYPKPH